jgi:hypothetical protein
VATEADPASQRSRPRRWALLPLLLLVVPAALLWLASLLHPTT